MRDDLLEKAKKMVKDKRRLINGISQRAAELAHGSKALVHCDPQDNGEYLDIALRELIEGKIVIPPGDAAT